MGWDLQNGGWNPPLHKQDLYFYTDFRMVPEKNARGRVLWINIEIDPYSERPARGSNDLMTERN
jgi:hypothetical protein